MPVPSPQPPFKNPVAVASAFGRFFYGVDSTVYFSQTIKSAKLVGKCYQLNDPTSDDLKDLLDTDGGVVPLDGAVNIRVIRPFRTGVLVFADNGVWYVYNPEGGFKATGFNVSKITERGIDSPKSVIPIEGTIMYFSENGIMQIVANEFDNLSATDITETTIRTHYLEKLQGKGTYAEYDSKNKEILFWNPDSEGNGLILDVTATAFYPQQNASNTRLLGRPLNIDGDIVYTSWEDNGTSFVYNFAKTQNILFKDFTIDQDAFLVSGEETIGKFSHKKNVAEAKFYFKKTETEITNYVDGQYVYDFPSSCLMQSRWDFDNSDAFAKWSGVLPDGTGRGGPIELYNVFRRGFIPDSYPYTINDGEGIIRKKVKINGVGDAVQFKFQASPEKDMQLLGYSVEYVMRGKM